MMAAVLLPVLLALDIVAIRLYRDSYDPTTLLYTLPASLVGVAVAWAVAAQIEPASFKILIGAIGIVFTLSIRIRPKANEPRAQSLARGSFREAIAGFTGFVTLTGGPPFQIYILPLRLPHRIYAGTFVIFMACGDAWPVRYQHAVDIAGAIATCILRNIARCRTDQVCVERIILPGYAHLDVCRQRQADHRWFNINTVRLTASPHEGMRTDTVRRG